MFKKGFTLIELLIVISLLGILVVGLFAVIDPFEQFKKGNDTALRNQVRDVYNSSVSYYASTRTFPWAVDVSGVSLTDSTFTSAGGYLDELVSAGELRAEFRDLVGGNLGKIFLTSTSDVNTIRRSVTVCYSPLSKGFAKDANSKYTVSGSLGDNCLGTGGTAVCYWCLK